MENTKRTRLISGLFIALLGLWIIGHVLVSAVSGEVAARWMTFAVNAVVTASTAVLGQLSAAVEQFIRTWAPVCLQMGGYMVLTLLNWLVLSRLSRIGLRARYGLSLSMTVLVAVADEMHQIIVPNRAPNVGDCLKNIGAAVFTLLVIAAWCALWQRFHKVFNAETVNYVVFGVLTTLVNIVTYNLMVPVLPMSEVSANLVANVIAWVFAVAFAYVVNKLFVFKSKTNSMKEALRECGMFIGARVLSLGVDELGMFLLVSVVHISGGVSKILMNVVVLVMNYFFSKLFIFKSPAADAVQSEGDSQDQESRS